MPSILQRGGRPSQGSKVSKSAFVATVTSTIVVFAFLKNHFAEESNGDSDVKFTNSIPSRPVARPPSVQLVQARPDDP